MYVHIVMIDVPYVHDAYMSYLIYYDGLFKLLIDKLFLVDTADY